MDEKLDHGPIISQFKEDVLRDDTADTLRKRLFARSAEVLTTLIPAYLRGKITPRPQDETEVVRTRQIKKEDAFIPPKYLKAFTYTTHEASEPSQVLKVPNLEKWDISFIKNYSLVPNAYSLDRFIRAMIPWPIAWTYIKLTKNSKLPTSPKLRRTGKTKDLKRLKILKAYIEKLVPNAHCLVPDLVQLEGKNEVSWQQFKSGYPDAKFA